MVTAQAERVGDLNASLLSQTTFEQGGHLSVVGDIQSGVVVKTSLIGYTEARAHQLVDEQERYLEALANEGIPVARQLSAGVVQQDGKFYPRFIADWVSDEGLHQVSPELRTQALRDIIGYIQNMLTVPGSGDLLTIGIDASAQNWRVNQRTGEVTYLDSFPSLFRDGRGQLRVERATVPSLQRELLGTQSGAIAQLLMWSYGLMETTTARALHGLSVHADELKGLIPPDLYDRVMGLMEEGVQVYTASHAGAMAVRAVIYA